MKTYTLEQLTNNYIGEKGTPERNKFDNDLRVDILGQTIKEVRKKQHLTQEQLGKMVGVKKAQISKIENSITDARFSTILKVFEALNTKINFNVQIG